MIRWPQLQSIFVDDPSLYWDYCQSRGMVCPWEVFTQLFAESVGTEAVPSITREVDWAAVHWSPEELTGEELRQIYIDRQLAPGVEEAYRAALDAGITDERVAVIHGWQHQQSWVVPPVLVTGSVLGGAFPHALLIGKTRLGNLRGLIDWGEVPLERRHQVFVGDLVR